MARHKSRLDAGAPTAMLRDMDKDAPPPLTLADMEAALIEAEQQLDAGQSVPASEVHAMLLRGPCAAVNAPD
jgi:hypothetical protein